MRSLLLVLILITTINLQIKAQTVTELLDEAQNSVKMAFEAHSDLKSPYEYSKAVTYYEIAKEETSKMNIEAGKAAALKSIEWALRAISNSYTGGEK